MTTANIIKGFLAAAALAFGAGAQAVDITGAGATFPFPIYATWFKAFSKATPGVTVDYQAKGSGAGIQDLINHTVDFAASDAAMTDGARRTFEEARLSDPAAG